MQIELIYEKTCPNIAAAREQLLRAFSRLGITPRWREWEVTCAESPAHIHGYGSPTLLVDGRDVSGDHQQGDDFCCRIYAGSDHVNKGIPALKDIIDAMQRSLQASNTKGGVTRFRMNSTLLPAIGVAFLPKLACPACWPAYAGLLGSLGIGFIDYTPFLFPLTALFLLIALGALIFRARQRRGYRPFVLGLLAAATLLIGKFQFDSDAAMYTGLGLLIAASLWNTWPTMEDRRNSCPACTSPAPEHKP